MELGRILKVVTVEPIEESKTEDPIFDPTPVAAEEEIDIFDAPTLTPAA